MTYAQLETLLGEVATQVLNGTGHFHCGNAVSLKEAVEANGFPIIQLDPLKGTRNGATGLKVTTITLGFFEQGGDLSNTEKSAIKERMENLSAVFMAVLEEEEVGEITFADYPVENYTSQQLLGWACECTIKLPFSLCF